MTQHVQNGAFCLPLIGSLRTLATLWLVACMTGSTPAAEVDVAPLVEKLQQIDIKGGGHRQAQAAWKQLSQASASQLTDILTGMKGANPLSENWLRAVVEVVAQRAARDGKLPVKQLESFLQDTSQSPRARRLAYELVAGADESAPQRLIPSLMNDPSVELRRDAVAFAMERAGEDESSVKREQVVEDYQKIFAAARDLDQIQTALKKLRQLDQKPNVPRHMGFLQQWHVVGPFDNDADVGFDRAYPPEQGVDLKAKYAGKVGQVGWMSFESSDDFGIIDLNVAFKRPKDGDNLKLTKEHKGAIAYAYTEFQSDSAREVQLRLGCINGNKIWVNNKLLTRNHVYHAGMEVDQYVSRVRLKPGKNTILLKIAQNEQTESWAQRWQFQLRVCDDIGTAVLSGKSAAKQSGLQRILR